MTTTTTGVALKQSDMPFRKLGNTGFDVSAVAFGTWQIGGGRWHACSTKDTTHLLRSAHELGVNLFDAAVVYGQYLDDCGYLQSRSQELLGDAFASLRDKVFYCVKIGQFDEISHRSSFDAARIVEHVRQSMRRLRTDYLDICLIHAPSLADVRRGTALEILRALQALGMVRAVGYSFENEPDHVRSALAQPVDVIMLQYNLLDHDCGDVLRLVAEEGVGVLVGGPYKRGYLTGRFTTVTELPTADPYWAWNVARNEGKVERTLDRVRDLLRKYESPDRLRRAALRFVIDAPAVSAAVIGHRALDEVRENIGHCAS